MYKQKNNGFIYLVVTIVIQTNIFRRGLKRFEIRVM